MLDRCDVFAHLLILKAFVGVAVLSLVVQCGCHQSSPPPALDAASAESLDATSDLAFFANALRATDARDWDVADDQLRKHLLVEPNDVRALELLGDVAAARGISDEAESMYRAAQLASTSPSRSLFDKRIKHLIRSGRPFDAIDVTQDLIEVFPNDPQPRFDLAGIAAAVGVTEAAIPSLQWLIQRGQSDEESLLVLADPERVEPDEETCKRFLALSDGDLRPGFGLAAFAALRGDWNSAAEQLAPIVQQHPGFEPAYALYGQCLFQLGDFAALATWQANAPATAEQSPEYWIVMARLHQHSAQHDLACRAFYQSLLLDPSSHPEVYAEFITSLYQIGRSEDAEKIAAEMTKLSAMRDALKIHLERSSQSQAACMRVADTMLGLGRVWESEAWARLAVSLPKDKLADLRPRYMEIREQLSVTTPWRLPTARIESKIDLGDLVSSNSVNIPKRPDGTIAIPVGAINFSNEAIQRGWMHLSIPSSSTGGYWIHESVGGGVAVIDFDLDGWPDLAAATLDGTALGNDSSPNRLSRNLNGMFTDVTKPSNYQDTGFGQGIAVGDYNDDGFPDLFDANIGRNRLYRNNGDGTFTDVSDSTGLDGSQWTTSVAMVDLDGDAILDLYDVNYCAGNTPYERECRNKFGLGTCSPLVFDAEPDRVWKGVGDGTFEDSTSMWMNQTSPGRGLGIVAGEIDEAPGIDVLVANDMTVNHLWASQIEASPFRLADVGVIRGLGTSGNSRSQASMGIAAGDADSDGDLDFFMTHFADDYNTYYEQIADGFWADRSFQVGLSEPSMKYLGFGTQWSDFDNRGNLELIIANGHVDRVDRPDVTYRMPPQFFSRTADGRWTEWDRSALGDYFSAEYLGRAIALVDIDRDGRTDVAITHVGDPAALLMNQTSDAGRSIGLELKAVSTPRDAVGARVTALVGSQQFSAQLTAGDGYMVSNQRRVVIGCATTDEVSDVAVQWPSGKVDRFGSLRAGHDYLLVEGDEMAQVMWNHP